MYRCVETGLDEKVELDHVSSLVGIKNWNWNWNWKGLFPGLVFSHALIIEQIIILA